MLFQLRGVDDLRERDVAEFLEPLPGLVVALKEHEKKYDDHDVKEEQETLAIVYQDESHALNTLKARFAGEAPWLEYSIPYPLVTLQQPYSPNNVYSDYEPKIFYYPERTYEDWLKMDVWEVLSKPLVNYLEENYFKERRRQLWMKSYRLDVYFASMDTNNYVESWHNQLKSNQLKNHYRARADRILYILAEVILEAFEKDEFVAIIRICRGTKGEVLDILHQQDVQAMTEETIQKYFLFIDGCYLVESITFPGIYYDLSLTDGLINSCICEYFLRYHRLYKHIPMAICKFPDNLRLPLNNNFYVSRTLAVSSTALDIEQQDNKQDETPEDE
ncbi:hypothetical protein BGZ95_005212, partial [Linnemannia exigua]